MDNVLIATHIHELFAKVPRTLHLNSAMQKNLRRWLASQNGKEHLEMVSKRAFCDVAFLPILAEDLCELSRLLEASSLTEEEKSTFNRCFIKHTDFDKKHFDLLNIFGKNRHKLLRWNLLVLMQAEHSATGALNNIVKVFTIAEPTTEKEILDVKASLTKFAF